MHHMRPFHGIAHIGYLPAATQIADWLQAEVEPKGVGVVLEAWP